MHAIVKARPGLLVKRVPDITARPFELATANRPVVVLETGIASAFPTLFREWWKIISPLGAAGYVAAVGPRGEHYLELAPHAPHAASLAPAATPAAPATPGHRSALAHVGTALARIGAETPQEASFIDRLRAGFKEITPTLILVGVATGFAFAIGSGLGSAVIHGLVLKRSKKSK